MRSRHLRPVFASALLRFSTIFDHVSGSSWAQLILIRFIPDGQKVLDHRGVAGRLGGHGDHYPDRPRPGRGSQQRVGVPFQDGAALLEGERRRAGGGGDRGARRTGQVLEDSQHPVDGREDAGLGPPERGGPTEASFSWSERTSLRRRAGWWERLLALSAFSGRMAPTRGSVLASTSRIEERSAETCERRSRYTSARAPRSSGVTGSGTSVLGLAAGLARPRTPPGPILGAPAWNPLRWPGRRGREGGEGLGG